MIRSAVACLKRVMDVVSATMLLTVLAPLVVVVAGMVWIGLGRPVLYRDDRAGFGGKAISVLKFRSMRPVAIDEAGSVTDADRLTPLGRFLRRTSLDELPQLLSVLNGDMSLVGPRPLPMRYVPRYSPRQRRRLDARPGITGWAQIHGRNALDWPERLEYDVQYVEFLDHWWAPILDLGIVAVTVFQVVRQAVTGAGISAPGVATMREFQP